MSSSSDKLLWNSNKSNASLKYEIRSAVRGLVQLLCHFTHNNYYNKAYIWSQSWMRRLKNGLVLPYFGQWNEPVMQKWCSSIPAELSRVWEHHKAWQSPQQQCSLVTRGERVERTPGFNFFVLTCVNLFEAVNGKHVVMSDGLVWLFDKIFFSFLFSLSHTVE